MTGILEDLNGDLSRNRRETVDNCYTEMMCMTDILEELSGNPSRNETKAIFLPNILSKQYPEQNDSEKKEREKKYVQVTNSICI